MRTYAYLLLVSSLMLAACEKEKYGNVKQVIRVTAGATPGQQRLAVDTSLRYTQFGDYITSLTPTSFVGEIYAIRFMSDSIESNVANMLTLAQADVMNGIGPLIADFSNNATIPIIPVLNGVNTIMTNEDGVGQFFKEKVEFPLLWVSMELRQTVVLPQPYSQVELRQFQGLLDDDEQIGNVLTTALASLNQKLGIPALNSNGLTLYFGMTDSTFFNYGVLLGNAPTNHIRSANYQSWTMVPPNPGQTKSYISTLGFNNQRIIQLYAGPDNIPYTEDDVVVLAPKFWERIEVSVEEVEGVYP